MDKNELINLIFIKEVRTSKGVTIEEMSKLLGYEGYQAYYYKEKGIRKMSAEDIGEIAHTLKVPINSLFLKKQLPKR